jgi:hypothetical protein
MRGKYPQGFKSPKQSTDFSPCHKKSKLRPDNSLATLPNCSSSGTTFTGPNPPRAYGPSTKQPYSQTAFGPWPGWWRRACHWNPSPLHQTARAHRALPIAAVAPIEINAVALLVQPSRLRLIRRRRRRCLPGRDMRLNTAETGKAASAGGWL